MSNIDTAVILVGGEGTRLRPLTYHTPKSLVPIANVPFLDRMIQWLSSHGIRRIKLVLWHMPSMLIEHVSNYPLRHVSIEYCVEPFHLGTAGAIRFALDDSQSAPFLVLNGDILTNLDLSMLMRRHLQSQAEATLSLIRVENPSMFGVVELNAAGRVVEFLEKPTQTPYISNLVNAGIYVMNPSILNHIAPDVDVSVEYDLFPHLLSKGIPMSGFVSARYWIDIGTPERYLNANWAVLDRTIPLTVHGVEREPSVWLGEGVELAGTLRPPVCIGDGCSIGANAVIGPYAVIGAGCRVGKDTQVTSSVILGRAAIGAGSKITDSIIGPDFCLTPPKP